MQQGARDPAEDALGMLGEAPTAPTAFGKASAQRSGQSFRVCQKGSRLKMHLNPCDLIQDFPAIPLTVWSHSKSHRPSLGTGTFCIALFSHLMIIYFPQGT